MKITAINGSPRGKMSSTHRMVENFLLGAARAGAETNEIFLAGKNIHPCTGCFSCWLKTPGQCMIQDDMKKTLQLLDGTDILILASPLYFDHLTAQLKAFMDRSIVKSNPHFYKSAEGECCHDRTDGENKKNLELIMISNCGFPERSQFQALSHWVQRAARNMKAQVLAEIYATEGGLLCAQSPESDALVKDYLKALQTAGEEIVKNRKLTAETEIALQQKFLPDEVYIAHANAFFDQMLQPAGR